MQEKKIIVLDHPQINLQALLKKFRLDSKENEDEAEELQDMVNEVSALAKPKSLYGISKIDDWDENGVVIDGIRLTSKLVSENLKGSSRVFPFVSTCGMEAEEWSKQFNGDPLAEYWADEIKLQLLAAVRKPLIDEINRYFPEGKSSIMSPGSLAAWPLPEQKPLFRILGGVTQDIGTVLTDSCLMVPSKSCSGFFFSTETHYVNCQYCPMASCPNRRAPFLREYTK